MKRSPIAAFAAPLLIFASLAAYHSHGGSVPLEWEKRFKELCSYDKEYCDSATRQVDKEVAKTLKTLKPVVEKAARLYGVDPRVISGSVLAEHSMNVGVTDKAQNFLAKTGIFPTGKAFGLSWSYGIGQIHTDTAKGVEKLAARIEKRPERTEEQIGKAIGTLDTAIFYVAAILRDAQDKYEKAGYSIKNKPEILATLYNLGKVDERVVKTKKDGRMPRPNYFGFFVEMHMKEIEAISPKPSAPAAPVASAAVAADSATVTNANIAIDPAATATDVPAPAPPPPPVDDSISVYELKNATKMSNGPVKCYDDNLFPADSLPFAKGTRLTAVSVDVDCDLEQWVRVRDSEGHTGWIKSQALIDRSEITKVPKDNCKKTIDTACRKEVMKELGEHAVKGGKPEETEFSLFVGGREVNGADGKPEIILSKTLTAEQKKTVAALKGYDNLSRKDIEEVQKAITAFQQRVATKLDLDPWGDSINPYAQYYEKILSSFESQCVNQGSCVLNKGEFIRWLNSIPIVKNPSAKELAITKSQETTLTPYQNYAHLRNFVMAAYEDLQARTEKELLEPIKRCRKITAPLPQSNQFLTEIGLQVADILKDAPDPGTPLLNPNSGNNYYGGGYYYGGVHQHASERAQKIASVAKTIQPLISACLAFEKTCSSFQYTQSVTGSGQQLTDDKGGTCWMNYKDPVTHSVTEMQKDVFGAMFKTPADRDKYLIETFKELKPNLEESSSRILTVRQLADRLASISCVKTLYVPDPWLASEKNQIFRDSDNSSSVHVDFGRTSCTLEKK